jgi:large subunit ribosomal protein L15
MSMIHEIVRNAPRYKRDKRKGRGESSGHGKTSGRGTKGAKARTGTYIKRGHEGGQTPIFRRFPKRGFSNDDFARRFAIVNLADLNLFPTGSIVDAEALMEKGLIPDSKLPVKILGHGELNHKLTVLAGWYSKSAREKITALGGDAQTDKGATFEFPKPKKKFIPRVPVKKVKLDEAAEGEAADAAKGKPAAKEGGKPEAAAAKAAPEATAAGDSPTPPPAS